MAVKNLHLPNFPSFDTDEILTLAPRWNTYKKRFELLCSAIGVTDNKQKLSMLLTLIGDGSYEIYENITPTPELSYTEVITLFDEHFKPQLNESYETYLFNQMRQKEEETIHQYYVRLREQAKKCNFHDMDKNIKQQIELSTTDGKLRKFSFRNPTKTLHQLLAEGKVMEDIAIQTLRLEKSVISSQDVNAVKKSTKRFGKNNFSPRGMSKSNTNKCFRCDGAYPHQQTCPAIGKECKKCKKTGHFARCCKTKPQTSFPPRNRTNNFQPMNHNRQQNYRQPLNNIAHSPQPNTTSAYSYNDDEYLFAVRNIFNKEEVVEQSEKVNFNRIVKIEKIKVQVLVDSGASVNILNKRTYEGLNNQLDNPIKIRKSKTTVITYGSEEPDLKILGETELLLESENKFTTTKFYVANADHKNLLSGTTAITLGILALRPPEVNTCAKFEQNNQHRKASNKTRVEQISPVNNNLNRTRDIKDNSKTPFLNNNNYGGEQKEMPERISKIIETYKNSVFSGKIGKLKDHQVKLHIDKNVTPVAQKERRIPFALRKKVSEEIERLQAEDIIEDVTKEPTPWLNPLVIIPKGDNSIRLCVDMRCANKAITRTRFPTPTVEDLMIKLKGAKVFSKLDLTSAFYQLELTPESRQITAFQTENTEKI